MQQASHTRLEVILTSEASGQSCSAAVWDPSNGSLLSLFKNTGALCRRSLQLLSDCYLLGADSTKHRLYVWPLNNSAPVNNIRLTTPGKINALTCTPNGSYIIAAIGENLFIWQTCSGRLLATFSEHLQKINCLSTTKDGSLFASGGDDGLVFVWSLFSALNDHCPIIHKFLHHSLPVNDLCFGYGGARTRLYTVSMDRTLNIYEIGNAQNMLSIIFDVPLTAITVNLRDSELFVGCITGDIFQCKLHNPPRGVVQHVKTSSRDAEKDDTLFEAHKSHVTALSVSLNCCTLLSGAVDGAVHIWDIASRHVLRTIKHKGPITAAFFAPAFENFSATTLMPRLVLHSLQQTSDDSNRNVLQVISRGRNSRKILDFDSYVRNDINEPRNSEETSASNAKLNLMKTEIERLRTINNDMYQYTVTSILNKKKENGRQSSEDNILPRSKPKIIENVPLDKLYSISIQD
ncbi:WD repeat-containing protein 18 [Harpegnathos saltator]|uniref:WD repeat-containing protein 18 n=1 Tax=Harpegnathos saltator TaxID=610380 RepID=E2BYJ9_HARSA|nr:WD repeat-containing protein 18 [Harpegnathos saltator]EFN79233.1 WD repeat-containing protein 18 [Harpegnathos saltator]